MFEFLDIHSKRNVVTEMCRMRLRNGTPTQPGFLDPDDTE